VIQWTETPWMRWRALGAQLWGTLFRALARWAMGWVCVCALFAWWNGHPPWDRHGQESMAVGAACGLILRVLLELMPRQARLEAGCFLLNPGSNQREWPLSQIQEVRVSDVGGGVVRVDVVAGRPGRRPTRLVLGARVRDVERIMGAFRTD
jgi:hypothetical protein